MQPLPSSRRPAVRRARVFSWLALIPLASVLAQGPAPAPDPLEGKWWGTTGSVRERVEVGLDFRRDAAGKLQLYLTQPISSYFAVPTEMEVKREGDRVLVDGLHLALSLKGDQLEGNYPGPNSSASFTRVESLPGDPGVPDFPKGPGPRWQTRLQGQIWATPAVRDGIAYVGTTGGVMNAVQVSDGQLAWTFTAGRPLFGEALATEDALYFVCDNGILFKLDRATGKERWRYELGDGQVPRVLPHPAVFEWDWQGPKPVMAEGVVFVGSGDGSFHAVDAATGERRWRFATGGKVRNGAVIDDSRVIFGSKDHFVYALDRKTGKELWKHETEAPIDGAPLVWGGKVLIGNRGGGLYALSAETGERLWRTFFWGSWVESTPVVAGGVLYIGSSDLRRVSALDPADGRVLWRTDVYGWTFGTPAIVGDRMFAGAAGGSPYFIRHVAGFAALERQTGRILWRWPMPEVPGAHEWGITGSPVISGDTVVVATLEGGLMGFPVG
ncbi:MAG TPA: PQQ-binding-like beta-propeller repeat protein [Thermoanaerobaculia bacterium]|nr:PQQ-binding-like beta-propeller repeat protein [Thermoanaerobaculia bacterium]